jgi:hypothetical protein
VKYWEFETRPRYPWSAFNFRLDPNHRKLEISNYTRKWISFKGTQRESNHYTIKRITSIELLLHMMYRMYRMCKHVSMVPSV